MLNTFPVLAEGNQPRAILTANGQSLLFDEVEVVNSNIYDADEFNATLPIKSQPNGYDDNYWSDITAVLLSVYIGFPPNAANGQYSPTDLDSTFVGQVDEVSIDPLNGCIHLTGRDLTAKFIDHKTSEKFQNLTFSQIATLLAQRRGLNPIVTPTTTKAGVYYANNYTQMARSIPEWDLLVFLAQQEQFVIYVDGLNLIAKPAPKPSDNPFVVQWQPENAVYGYPVCNVNRPMFSRSLTIAKDVIVKIRSYSLGTKGSFTVTAQATHNKKTVISGMAQPVGDAQVYSRTIPGLTPEQARQRAMQILEEITRHEINFEFELPGTNLIKKDTIIQTQGFADGLNQIYYPDNIRRRFSISEGYQGTVHAKNHSPISTIIV